MKTRWILYHHPAQLIRAAAALYPQWRLHGFTLYCATPSKRRPHLDLDYGRSEEGRVWMVRVTVEPQDVSAILAYL